MKGEPSFIIIGESLINIREKRSPTFAVVLLGLMSLIGMSGIAHGHDIWGIAFTPQSPAINSLGEYVDITFSYETEEPGGVRILARPFTDGEGTPGFAAHGSPLYPIGSGTGDGFFTINSSEQHVDQVRFQMLNADQSELLLEFFVPVDYWFTSNGCDVDDDGVLSISDVLGLRQICRDSFLPSCDVNLDGDYNVRDLLQFWRVCR
ncbi:MULTISPECIES: hypothetical protein [unclassified Thiocapsa]|uniref:hypothetical protein n=1 Tax=unclassified Thiocapsa TaxID=2641286 RepID=UPI0035B03491